MKKLILFFLCMVTVSCAKNESKSIRANHSDPANEHVVPVQYAYFTYELRSLSDQSIVLNTTEIFESYHKPGELWKLHEDFIKKFENSSDAQTHILRKFEVHSYNSYSEAQEAKDYDEEHRMGNKVGEWMEEDNIEYPAIDSI